MPILTSPSVAVVEKDYSQVVPFASTGEGAIAGMFTQGPINQPILVTNTDELETYFGRPVQGTTGNYKEWYVAYNFLQYSGKLWVTRIEPTGVLNSAATTAIKILNTDDYENKLTYSPSDLTAAGQWICKQSGDIGNNIQVVMADKAAYDLLALDAQKGADHSVTAASWLTGSVTLTIGSHNYVSTDPIVVSGVTPGAYNGSYVVTGTTSTSVTYALVADPGTWIGGGNVTGTSVYSSESRHITAYLRQGEPGTSEFMTVTGGNATALDELCVFVIDKTGKISGVAGKILELHENLSKAADATDYLGRNIYYKEFINNYSNWIYWAAEPTTLGVSGTAWGAFSYTTTTTAFKALTAINSKTLTGGTNGTLTTAEKTAALQVSYALYRNKESINVSYILTVDYPTAVQQYCVDSLAEYRRDAIAFISPHNDGVPFINKQTMVTDLLSFRNVTLNVNSSFAVMDSGYKYQFDGYNKVYCWVPLNGDIAGLCARLDSDFESWYSPGGFTRGRIKNAMKLNANLDQGARDQLYPKQINAVVSFPGKGTVLFGDRTMQSKPSAFQSIHIRRLFIILEKAIEEASKYQLFELNNSTTRGQFSGMIEPFLRSVQGRDGLGDFKVVCDGTNNPDDVVARGEFVADIYIKPLYSIQYVILNFVATKSSVQFNQLIKAA